MEEFIRYLKNRFKQPLLPNKAHNEMLPGTGNKHSSEPGDISKAAKSGVLILFYPKDDKIFTVFIERPLYDGVHSGQIAFPGGKTEYNDKTLAETAIREANEEIGIEKRKVAVIGSLSDVFVSPSNYIITPFVGIYKNEPLFSIDEKEVKRLIQIPFCEIVKKENIAKAKVEASDGIIYEVPCFKFGNNIIWGATAMILNEFIYLWNSNR